VSALIKVLIADDNARMRALVRDALEADGGFTVCGEAADADGAVAIATAEGPDVCLVDINMPGGGIAAVAHITAARPTTRVIVLTVSREDNDLFDALRAGADGYLLKGSDEMLITESIRRVVAGEATLPGTLVARLVEEFRDREARRVPIANGQSARLTGREWDVLELLREGLTTAEMAQRLYVSQTTVRSHVAAVLRKLRVPDRDAAIRLLQERAHPQA
jgi:DNA-binding NarL/FixJ family response regulator